ncbi:unnamed protein product [Spirodela intermedia]|uniref:phosphopantothenoylcysteine decarboxylase n=1 Tax=Spirodela intermedia TaxID=51605 RepID=A0A7I8IRP6_SPIIN|nr:unnamed protein product [Spirodela intermedia]CAA6659641.1 unnamed protein product [Spirodela intermedia]
MECSEPLGLVRSDLQTRRSHVLLAASGSVAAIKFENLCRSFSEWPRDVVLYTDDDEWSTWSKIGDSVLHIELRKWADLMVIAPLSANTLGKPLFVAPAMNTFMWNNPFTERHLSLITELGISLIPPVTKRLACGDYGNGAMAEPSVINATVRLSFPHPFLNVSNPHPPRGGTSLLSKY